MKKYILTIALMLGVVAALSSCSDKALEEDITEYDYPRIIGGNWPSYVQLLTPFGDQLKENYAVELKKEIDNPKKEGINTSFYVASYRKKDQWPAAEVRLPGADEFDMTTYDKVSVKVYFPGTSEDYDKDGFTSKVVARYRADDSDYGGPAVTTDVTKFNEWEELFFDFKTIAQAGKKIFQLQLGGEGHFGTGTLYFDDLKIYGVNSSGEEVVYAYEDFELRQPGTINGLLGQTQTIYSQYTPYAYATAKWYLDGEEVSRGNTYTFTADQLGTYYLKMIVTTPHHETYRDARLVIKLDE